MKRLIVIIAILSLAGAGAVTTPNTSHIFVGRFVGTFLLLTFGAWLGLIIGVEYGAKAERARQRHEKTEAATSSNHA